MGYVQLAFPLLINSYWAFMPASVSAILLIVRSAMEDRVLTSPVDRVPRVRRKDTIDAHSRRVPRPLTSITVRSGFVEPGRRGPSQLTSPRHAAYRPP
jgi:hypothetical protein